ncbi:MAG: protein translocase subunit SecD [Phycisphaeraceae bacterium]|nr:protein translocase subunit SecD [Phycisphaeraceae bacterium]
MERYPLWKPILVLASIAFALLMLYPPQRKLKPGLDLAGGTTLVYQVNVPDDVDSQSAIEQVIASLKKRVDPKGVRNLVWRRLAGERFEVQMALASSEAKTLRKAYLDQQASLIAGNLSQRELDRAMKLADEDRTRELDRLASGNASRRATLLKLSEASDALAAVSKPYEELGGKVQQSDAALAALPADAPEAKKKELEAKRNELLKQLVPVTRQYTQAQSAVDEARKAALTSNINPDELDRVLTLPDRPRENKKALEGQIVKTVRQEAVDKFLEHHEDRQAELKAVIDAYLAYDKVKGPLDDPADLVALLRGSGVLEFRIAPKGGSLADEADYRKQLTDKGPRAGADKPYRWLVVDRDENGAISFAETSRQMTELEADPQAYFAKMGLIGQAYAGDYYLLLSDTPDKSLTRSRSGWELSRAFPDMDSTGFPAVSFRLNQIGGAMMADLTGSHINEPMAICLDGRVISAPRINDRIADRGIITGGSGGFSARELNYLVRTLNAGALTARVSDEPISIKTTGPQLGQDNLKHGLAAILWAFVIVSAFMVVYYFLSGVVAVGALVINIVLTLGAMAMIDATFTLPGIAGIVLTIGMAVDANVLIYERIREETESGQPLHIAVRRGFEKAFGTILDSNLTTLITCVVLYYTATTELKGFALVLGIGLVANMFTGVFCSRVVFELIIRWTHAKKLPMLPMVSTKVRSLLSPRIDWMGKLPIFLTISAIFWVGGLAVAIYRGQDLLDIEFRSGTEVSFELKKGQTLSIPEVRSILDQTARDFNTEELSGSRARVITLGESEGLRANSFSVQTLEQDSNKVSNAIKNGFAAYLDQELPLKFAGMDVKEVHQAPLRIVAHSRLGDNIGRDVGDDVGEYLGGIAIVLQDIRPAATEADLEGRIKRMRMQPAFEGLGYRQFEVIGLDLAAGGTGGSAHYTSAVILSRDNATNYIDEPESMTANDDGLAATEWHLVREALTRNTSLGSVSNFSSQVSNTMKIQALQAMALSLLAVGIYIWLRFGRLSFSLAAVVSLAHDVGIALGLVAVCHYFADTAIGRVLMLSDFKVDLALISALLTLVGYSLNDTIVVFDRIRENRGRLAEATPGIINDSINQTFSRSIITNTTALLSVLVLYVIGGEGIHGFGFCMVVGVIVGSYSSIAIAAPILLLRRRKTDPTSTAVTSPQTR